MRSAIIAAAFAAGAIAVPHNKHRDVKMETDYNVVYVTDVVTVTGGGAPATTEVPVAAPSPKNGGWSGWHWGHHSHKSSASSSAQESEAPAPSTYAAPAPTTTEQPAPTTEASSTKAAAATTEASSAASSPSTVSGYQDIVVFHHNVHRQNHSASDLAWDAALAATAAKIAQTCKYGHSLDVDGGGYGQNIAAGVESNNISAVITDHLYNGEVGLFANEFGKAQPDMSKLEKWGHFTQIVWADTTHVGCATQDCTNHPGGLANVDSLVPPYFTVCNYGPPGNYANEYGDNVKSSKGEPSVNWADGLKW